MGARTEVPAESPETGGDGLVEEVDQTDALKAEVDAEERPAAEAAPADEPDTVDRPEGALRLVVKGQVFITKPLSQWPNSTFDDLERARYAAWARKVLLPQSLRLWVEVDATIGECGAALNQWVRAMLGDPGK